MCTKDLVDKNIIMDKVTIKNSFHIQFLLRKANTVLVSQLYFMLPMSGWEVQHLIILYPFTQSKILRSLTQTLTCELFTWMVNLQVVSLIQHTVEWTIKAKLNHLSTKRDPC